MTELTELQAIARKHLSGDSARLCLTRSIECWDDLEDYQSACFQALLSIKHSKGICSPIYQKALDIFKKVQ